MADIKQTIPPHGCWQCKLEFENLTRDETVGFWQAFSQLWSNDSEDARKLAIEMAEEWVDNRFAEVHEEHRPESWIG